MDALQIITTAIKAALVADSAITDIISDRVWINVAPPPIEKGLTTWNNFPYILMSYSNGGILNDASYDAVDMEILVTCVGKESAICKAIASLIRDDLHRKRLTYSEGWTPYSTTRESDQFSRELTTQNLEYFQIGAYYRFRIEKRT